MRSSNGVRCDTVLSLSLGRFDESRYEVDRPRPERKSLREGMTGVGC